MRGWGQGEDDRQERRHPLEFHYDFLREKRAY
jgi:hypothetical protein